MKIIPFIHLFILPYYFSCSGNNSNDVSKVFQINKNNNYPMNSENSGKLDTATFGAGCFWCVEAIFQQVNGVISVQSGYSGGNIINPSYKEVCSGRTGHAEVCQLVYDPSVVSYDELLEIFWQTHDPTTLNRQGADVGTQYRSVVFYHNDYQKDRAVYFKDKLNQENAFLSPIVTEISPFINFYKAEDYHQNYYNLNSGEGYCRIVIKPKLDKFEKVFKDKMKP